MAEHTPRWGGENPARRVPRALALLVIFCLLAACGGGGNDAGGPSGGSGNPGNPAPPGSVTLEWDTPAGASILGFKIYYGTQSGTYLQPFGQGVDVSVLNSYSVAGLSSGTTYYFATTAYDAIGESTYSNEISAVIP